MDTRTACACLLLSIALTFTPGCSTVHPSKTIPSSTKVAFENDKVRVVEYHTGTGKDICGAGMHTHPAHLYIMLTDAKIRVVTPDGKESVEDSKAGEIGWEPAEQHIAENLTGNDARCYVIEIKDKDWKPSSGLSK